jgi:zinc transporter 2
MAPNLLQHQNKCQLSSSIDHIHDDELESRAFEKRDNPFESTVVNESKCDPINVESQVSVLRRLKIAAFVCSVFLVVELIGGAVAGSLAVLSDAAHRATDLMAYIVFILGSYVATLPASKNYTFGLKRAESIVALFTMFSVAAISISLAIEAILQIWRFIRTPREMGDMDAKMMFILASIGVAINIILVPILKENHVHFGDGDPHSHCHSHGGEKWFM